MDDGTPTLEVGFAIDAGGSFDTLVQLASLMDSTEGKIVADAARIERATGGMLNLGGATASISSFGAAATRELQTAAREMARAEKAGESLSRQLDRQALTFGKTREEIRAMKVETAALAAEQQGLTELAGRLRSQEASLYAEEFAAARKARLEAEAAAEAKQIAAQQAATAAELEAKAIREAAWAYQMFEARARQGAAALREVEAAEKAAGRDKAAVEMRAEAAAAAQLAAEHGRLAAMVRGSHDAQEADAASAERMRMATDPLYAATKRLNAEIAESTRLYHLGATAPGEYARQQEVLTQRLHAATAEHNLMATAAGKNAFALRMMAIQTPDIVQGLLTGQKPMTIFIQQGGQIAQIAMMAEGGIKGMAKQLALLALIASPVLAVIGVAAGGAYIAFKKFQDNVKDSGELTHYRDSLGLTHKEMLKLSDGVDKAGGKIKELTGVTITAGDMMSGIWKTIADQADASGTWESIKKGAGDAFEWVLEAWQKAAAGITAGIYGTFNAVKTIWASFPAVFGEIFVNAVNAAITALNALVQKGVDQLNSFIALANVIPGVKLGGLAAPQIAPVVNTNAGAAAKMTKDLGDGYVDAYKRAREEDAKFWNQARHNALQSAKDRMKAEADAIKANRTAPKSKVDHNALNAEATEAQIRNLYKLADAYGVSGAAALIAEARVKAESDAIKKRADIEAAVDRQIRLSIAQRVSDAAKSTATTREQASAQEQVNALVAAGLVPAANAAELIKNQIADLPLLAAIQVAQQRGLTTEAARATQALADQRAERARLTATETAARLNSGIAAGTDRLAELREELRLIGATDEARARALATLKAQQEVATWAGADPAKAAEYVKLQGDLAVQTVRNTQAQNAYNDSLSFAADRWEMIARNVENAGQGMADAFGNAGRALGNLASIYAGYQADRARLDQKHTADIDKAGKDQAQIERVNARFALESATSQIGAFGDMASAAKGFFDEKSKGYQAMLEAEKVFRAIEFALSIKAMAQDAIETGTKLASSAARTAANAVEAVTKAIASLPFPANLVAGAATIAALASIGVSLAGSFGGGGSKPAPSNTGTGTVLGDSAAKSESIKNAIDALKEVDTLTNTFAREMAASLKSIDSQIGNVASLVVRSGNIDASSGVTEGFKTDAIGSILSKIPLIGGLLGSLFGSTTKITGTGLYAGAQSVGSILSGGFDASNYTDIEKTKKFLGITTGHSYSTQYAGADPTLENQFALILRSFDDAIAAAAGPLGVATSDVQDRLNSFVVNLGKIDLNGLTGAEIQDKLSAVFGAAADGMANAAFPGITQFQKVGEGAFETLVRVASTVEAVTSALDELGSSTQGLGIAAKLGIADQFDSVSSLTSAADAYFQAFYSKEEQAAAKTAQFAKVFDSLGLTMPDTLASFRQLVEAQDLTTSAGQATYATLLQLAPAFADLQSSMEGAKSAADIASERQDLQRQLLELLGDTAALRALDLAKLDASNRALQQQVWAVQDAQDAAKAANDLRDAWVSVGDSIEDEVKRIRGLNGAASGGSFADLQGQFNAATAAARAGDQEAAKSLPGLSQALLEAAAQVATSRQELSRVQAQTAASLELTNSTITALSSAQATSSTAALLQAQAAAQAALNSASASSSLIASPATPTSTAEILAAASTTQPTSPAANDDLVAAIAAVQDEIAQLREDNNSGNATIAGNTGKLNKKFDDLTGASGGEAISMAMVA